MESSHLHDRDRHEHRQDQTADQSPQPTLHSPAFTRSSTDSQDLDLKTHVHPPTPDMDEARIQATRRRKAALKNHPNGRLAASMVDKSNTGRQHIIGMGRADKANLHPNAKDLVDDGHHSDFSSVSTSDDVELDHFSSEAELSDDEEIGLTKPDVSKRKQKKRRHTQLDERVVGNAEGTDQERSLAKKRVIPALAMTALLIGSWYTFSLSISIVSLFGLFMGWIRRTDSIYSITNGCSRRNISIFVSHCSRHVCTCLCNLP